MEASGTKVWTTGKGGYDHVVFCERESMEGKGRRRGRSFRVGLEWKPHRRNNRRMEKSDE